MVVFVNGILQIEVLEDDVSVLDVKVCHFLEENLIYGDLWLTQMMMSYFYRVKLRS